MIEDLIKTNLDIDECAQAELNTCSDNSECVDTDGSFICVCEQGYFSLDGECFDLNECINNNLNVCPDNSWCYNTEGSYTCVCKDGFVGPIDENGTKICYNINECLDNNSCEFGSNAFCEDTFGSFKCSCPSNMLGTGYIGDPCKVVSA